MKEQISALMDGEVDLDAAPHVYAALRKEGGTASADWAAWHVIGDVMRGEFVAQSNMQARVMKQIDAEPTVLAPRRSLLESLRSTYAVPMAASVAAVAFVGWVVWQSQGGIALQPEMAQPSVAQNTMPPEALSGYMLAHHEYAPSNGMQHDFNIRPVTYSESRN